MNNHQKMVKEFHETFELVTLQKPGFPDETTRNLRIKLIEEELKEFMEAINQWELIEVADALADLLYVVYGAGLSFGIDLEPVFSEIHKSNMSKVGGHKNEDGKWVKPNTYSPPDLYPILINQEPIE